MPRTGSSASVRADWARSAVAPSFWRPVELELADVLQDHVDLREDLAPLIAQAPDLALELRVLLAQPADRLRGALHGLLELGQSFDDIVAHHPLRRVMGKVSVTRRTIRSWIAFTSSSVSVRSSAWNRSRHARLDRPSGNRKTSKSTTRRRRDPAASRIADSTWAAVGGRSPPRTNARSRSTTGNRGSAW